MSVNSKVPEIRFKGFGGDWEEKELNKEVELFSGLTYSPSDIRNSGTLVLRSSNVKNGQLIEADNVYVNHAVVNCSNVMEGDVIVVVRNGSRSLIGKHAQVTSRMDNTVIGAFMTGIRSKQPAFINALLDTNMFTTEVEKNLGATINQITNGAFKTMAFMLPTEDEKQEIGNYFQKLDTLINQHQQKHDKLSSIKKSMLEKMFPKQGETIPEIRFRGFSGEWEEKRVGQLGEIITGSTPSTQKSINYSNDGIPWVTPTDISRNVTFNTSKKLSQTGCKVARIVPRNTILVTCIASIGKNTILGTQGSFNQQINGVVPNEKENDPYFLFSASILWSKKLKRSAASGTMQIVNKTEFSELKTRVPKKEEQVVIGNYFQNLDTLINQHQQQITKLNNIKQACLSKMFV